MKNRKHSPHNLPAGVRTNSSRKLAGMKRNKPLYGTSPITGTGPWDKSHCGCGHLTVSCPALRRLDRFMRDIRLDDEDQLLLRRLNSGNQRRIHTTMALIADDVRLTRKLKSLNDA